MDSSIGVYIIDRYTYYALDFLEKVKPDSDKSLGQFVSRKSPKVLFPYFKFTNIILWKLLLTAASVS